MMGAYRQVRFQANPLTWLLLCLTGIMSIILVHSEVGGLCLAVFCIAIHLLTGHSDKAIPYSVCYLAFTGIAWGGVGLVESEVAFSVSSMLASLGVLGRKSIIPLSFAICLAKEPTGSLLASLQAMRLPKAVGIGLAVLLRFFPTIGGEYRAIRASQRFRGIGVGVVHTLTHLLNGGIHTDPTDSAHDKSRRRTLCLHDGAWSTLFGKQFPTVLCALQERMLRSARWQF